MPKYEVQVEITTVERKTIKVAADSPEHAAKLQDYHLGPNWSRGQRTFRVIGEPVELTDSVQFERCIPKVEQWELYSTKRGWRTIASRLNNRLSTAFRRVQKKPASKVREALRIERKKLYDVMGTEPFINFGAADSEPRNCADDAFEKFARTILGLNVMFSYGGMVED